jgi:hypothetical protein
MTLNFSKGKNSFKKETAPKCICHNRFLILHHVPYWLFAILCLLT